MDSDGRGGAVAEKLYVVVREDLPPGLQAAQSVHAALEFAHEHPDLESPWHLGSNTLALLSVRGEAELGRLLRRARVRGIRTSEFREPDLGGELTAAAFEPGDGSGRLLRRLGPALGGRRGCRVPACPDPPTPIRP